jgi:hypothetical protein
LKRGLIYDKYPVGLVRPRSSPLENFFWYGQGFRVVEK